MKNIFYILIAIFVLLPTQASAALEIVSFTPDLVYNNDCQLQLEYSLQVVPASIAITSNYFVSVVPASDAEIQDIPVPAFPGDGIIPTQTVTLTGLGTGDYQVKILENGPAITGQYSTNDLFVPSCESGSTNNSSSNTNNPSSANTQNPSTSVTQNPDMEIPIENPISVGTIPELIQKALEGIIKIGIPLLVVMIIYAGVLYIFAAGNVAKLKSAHDAFLYTLLGGAILLGAWALAQLIQSTLVDLTAYTSGFFL